MKSEQLELRLDLTGYQSQRLVNTNGLMQELTQQSPYDDVSCQIVPDAYHGTISPRVVGIEEDKYQEVFIQNDGKVITMTKQGKSQEYKFLVDGYKCTAIPVDNTTKTFIHQMDQMVCRMILKPQSI